jgi:hypothetical protein
VSTSAGFTETDVLSGGLESVVLVALTVKLVAPAQAVLPKALP